jgi:hypothetical protein
MLFHPIIPSDLPPAFSRFLHGDGFHLETPKSIALAGSQPSVSRRRPEALICIKASALGFDAIGSGHARLPVNHGAGHWTFDESRVASSRRRIFGAWFGEFPELKSRFSFALKVHLR